MSGLYKTLTCPACGAKVAIMQNTCQYCGSHLIIESDNSNSLDCLKMLRMLKGKMYNEARQLSENVTLTENVELLFYKCIAIIGGRKPFLMSRSEIDECITLTDYIMNIAPFCEVYLLRAYLEYDYFERKYLNRNPNYAYFVDLAGKTEYDYSKRVQLEELLGNKINIGEA